MTKLLARRRMRLQKAVAAFGGFMILAGTLLLGAAALAISGFLEVGLILETRYLLIFSLLMISVGLLDTFAAIVIARW